MPRSPERAAVSWLKGTATPPPHALSRRASGPPPSLPHPHRQICAQSSEPEGGAMRSAPSRCAVARALVLAGLWLAAAGRPLAFSDAGPHVHYGWGESVRLRHLYTAGPQGLYSCFLRIHSDGAVDCAQVQSAHSECPPGPHPSQRPFFPLPLSRSRNPGSWHLAISPSPTPRLREASHGHHQKVNTEIRSIIFFVAEDGEALYSQQKQDQELTVAQIMKPHFYCQIQT